jgi:hypothetical protein
LMAIFPFDRDVSRKVGDDRAAIRSVAVEANASADL